MSQEVEFSPNYGKECQSCGQKPTVQVIEYESQMLIEDSGLCGVCYFGESSCIDPEEW